MSGGGGYWVVSWILRVVPLFQRVRETLSPGLRRSMAEKMSAGFLMGRSLIWVMTSPRAVRRRPRP